MLSKADEERIGEYSKMLQNIPIMAKDGYSLKYLRCGMCNMNNIKDWDAHAKTDEHISLTSKWKILWRVTDGHIDMKELLVASQKMTSEEVVKMFELTKKAKEPEEQKRLNRRKVEKILGER